MDGAAPLQAHHVSIRGPSRVALVHMPLSESRRPSTQLGVVQTLLQQRGIVAHAHYLNLSFARRIGWALNDALCRGTQAAALVDGLLARELDGPCAQALAGFDARVVRLLRAEARAFVAECVERVPWHEYATVTFASRPGQLRFAQCLARELERAWPHLRVSLDLGRALATILAGERASRPLVARVTTRSPSFDDFFAEAARVELPALVDGEAIVIPLGETGATDVDALADEARRMTARHGAVAFSVDDRVLPPAAIPAFHDAGGVVFEYVGAAPIDRRALALLRACGCRRLCRGRLERDRGWLDQIAVLGWADRLGMTVRWETAATGLEGLAHLPAPQGGYPRPGAVLQARACDQGIEILDTRRGAASRHGFGPVHAAVLAACDAPRAESELCATLGPTLHVSAEHIALACEQLAAIDVLLGDGTRWLSLVPP